MNYNGKIEEPREDYLKLEESLDGGVYGETSMSLGCADGDGGWFWSLWWWLKMMLVVTFLGVLAAIFCKWIGPFFMDKVEQGFSVIDQKLENVTGFEELRFDDIEPFRYGFVSRQESPSLPGGSIDLRNYDGIEDGFNFSIRFGSKEVALNAADINQLTTVYVWCIIEFKLDDVESKSPSNSNGYMCLTCKDNNGSPSMDPDGF